MNKSWNLGIVMSVIGRLLGVIAILAFVFAMVVFTGKLTCLWLLFLLLTVEFIPVYTFKTENQRAVPSDTDNKNKEFK